MRAGAAQCLTAPAVSLSEDKHWENNNPFIILFEKTIVKYTRKAFHFYTSSVIYGSLWRFSTAWYGTVRFTFGGFSTGYSTWYFSSTTSAGVPSDPYRYQNVTCKLYWSLIGRRKSSLLRHWTCDTRPNIDPLDLNQHSQWRIGRNFLYQPKHFCFVVCWGSTDVPLVDSRGADPARAWWRDAEGKSLMYILFALYIFLECFQFIFLPSYLCFASIKNNLIE